MTEKIIEMIAEKLGLEADSIKVDSRFKEDLGIDSLDLFDLIIALEEEYNIEIPQEDAAALTTVNGVAEYLEKKGV